MDLSTACSASNFYGQMEGRDTYYPDTFNRWKLHSLQWIILRRGYDALILWLRSLTKEYTCISMNHIVIWQELPVRRKRKNLVNANLQSHLSGTLISVTLELIRKRSSLYFFFKFYIRSRICNDLYRRQKYIQQVISVFTAYFSAFFLLGNITSKQERLPVLQFLAKTESEWWVFSNNRNQVILYNTPGKLNQLGYQKTDDLLLFLFFSFFLRNWSPYILLIVIYQQ